MLPDKTFHFFESKEEQLEYLHRYKLLAPTINKIPTFYYRFHDITKVCKVVGYETNYETWSMTVIDIGEGPFCIHCDYFKEMQASPDRNKGSRIDTLPESYVIFDLETTDLNIYLAEIIQIGAIKVVNGEIQDTFLSYVRPSNPIPEHISKITGITDLDVCMAPDIKTVLPQFLSYIGNECLAGYNIHSYDTNILYDQIKSLLGIDFNNNYFDYKYYFQGIISKDEVPNYKLTTIAENFGIDTTGAHNALTDCYLCFSCYNALLPENDSVEISDINNIGTDFEKNLLEKIQAYIQSEELPENCLYFYSNRGKGIKEISKSIGIWEPPYPRNTAAPSSIGKNATCLKFSQSEHTITLTIRAKQYNSLPFPDANEVKPQYNGKKEIQFYNIVIDLNNPALLEYIIKNCDYSVKNYTSNSSFGCCSQFMRCSDEKKCVHENKLYSTGCKYRQNLDQGRIFYGKNRNVD